MIPIRKTKQIREELGLTHLVIFGTTSDGQQHVATHGKSKIHAEEAARAGNNLKKALQWPEEFCNSKPLSRICGHCDFFQRKKIEPGDRVPENIPGYCLYEPTKVPRFEDDKACSHFEPNL